jgi:hypothetical protein
MNACDFYWLLCKIFICFFTLPFIIILWSWKSLMPAQLHFSGYVMAFILLNIVSFLCVLYPITNHFVDNILVLFEILFGIFWFRSVIRSSFWKKIVLVFGLSLLFLYAYEVFFESNFWMLADKSAMGKSIFFTIFSTIGLTELMLYDNINFKRNSVFLLLTGLVTINGFSGIYYPFRYKIMLVSSQISCNFESALLLLQMGVLLLYSYAFYIAKVHHS